MKLSRAGTVLITLTLIIHAVSGGRVIKQHPTLASLQNPHRSLLRHGEDAAPAVHENNSTANQAVKPVISGAKLKGKQAAMMDAKTLIGICVMGASLVVIALLVLWCKLLHRGKGNNGGGGEPDVVPRQFCINGVGILKISENCVGRGSFGVVWEGILLGQADHGLRMKVAVKEVWTKTFAVDLPGPPALEASGMLESLRHANIVKCYGSLLDQSRDRSTNLIILELLPYTLHQLIHDDDRFSRKCKYRDLLCIFHGIAAGLEYLHSEKRVIHFDLNPRNVMMESNNLPKISDFGVSKIQKDGSVEVTSLKGTKPYIAPEVDFYAQNTEGQHRVSHFVDIYSLGVLMWECVMRQKLNNVSIYQLEDKDGVCIFSATGPKTYRCDCPEPLKRLIQQCVQFNGNRIVSHVVSNEYFSESYNRPSTRLILIELGKMLREPWIDEKPRAWKQSLTSHQE